MLCFMRILLTSPPIVIHAQPLVAVFCGFYHCREPLLVATSNNGTMISDAIAISMNDEEKGVVD